MNRDPQASIVNRRELLGNLISGMGVIVAPSEATRFIPKYEVETLMVSHEVTLKIVRGDPRILMKILTSYQDKLWPGWRAHKAMIDRMARFYEIAIQRHSMAFDYSNQTTVAAFEYAIVEAKGGGSE